MIAETQEITVWQEFQATRCPALREQLILESVPLVHFLLNRMGINAGFGSDYEDLVHQGLLGLIDAVDKFDPAVGARFTTYASMRIRGKVLDYMRSSDWLTRGARQRVRNIQNTITSLWSKFEREPSEDEIATAMGIDTAEVQQGLIDASRSLVSLDTFYEEDDDNEGSLLERLADETQVDPSEQFADDEIKTRLAGAIMQLERREQLVLSLYYHENLTFKEIGRVMEISESRVCQLHTRAILSLKAVLADE